MGTLWLPNGRPYGHYGGAMGAEHYFIPLRADGMGWIDRSLAPTDRSAANLRRSTAQPQIVDVDVLSTSNINRTSLLRPHADPPGASIQPWLPGAVLGLQRLAGNQAVAALFAAQRPRPLSHRVSSGSVSVQRCGTHPCNGSCPGHGRNASGEAIQSSGDRGRDDWHLQRQGVPVMPAACAYEPGERRHAASGAGVLIPDVSLLAAIESAYSASGDSVVVGDFAPGSAELKASTIAELKGSWIKILEPQASQHYEIFGFSDCVGDSAHNSRLRDDRARAVATILPQTAKRAASVGAAATGGFIMANASPVERAWNRSVLLRLQPAPPPTPKKTDDPSVITKRPPAATKSCSPGQRDQLSIAFPGARRMAEMAVKLLAGGASGLNGVQRKALDLYFGPDWRPHVAEIRAGYQKILAGWKDWDEHAQCHLDSEASCPTSDPHTVTLAYVMGKRYPVRHFGDVHVCATAFTLGDEELSATILHELSHRLDNTDDHKYCWAADGYCESVSTEDAIDNADSYAQFARQVWNFSP
jgi:outer membrane protein OmpA-like peptidoglycan-associated protein